MSITIERTLKTSCASTPSGIVVKTRIRVGRWREAD
jgi:hypothetical protein